MERTTSGEARPRSKSSQEMNSRADVWCEAFAVEDPVRSQQSYIVRLANWPQLPFSGELPHMVRALLRRGSRRIVLDLAVVWGIDAAAIGELVRAYNIAIAANAALLIANPNPRVREMLERVGLFDRLSADPNDTKDHSEVSRRAIC